MIRTGLRVLLTLGASLLVLVLGSGVASACSCAQLSLDEQVDAAGVVARVTVEKIDWPRGDNRLASYHVAATRVWKGDVPLRFVFVSERDGASCGLEGVAEGQDLLLFARLRGELPGEGSDTLSSNLCSGTTIATGEQVGLITDLLGEGTVPVDTGADPAAHTWPDPEWLVPAVVVALLVVAVVVILLRRPRARPEQ